MTVIRKNPVEFLMSLHNFVSEDSEIVDALSKEEVAARLKKENIDTSQLIADVQKRIRKIKAQAELDEAEHERNLLLEKFKNTEPEKSASIRDKIKELIDNLSISGQELALYYRKFESATDKDLDGLYNDLKILNEMKKNEPKKQSEPE